MSETAALAMTEGTTVETKSTDATEATKSTVASEATTVSLDAAEDPTPLLEECAARAEMEAGMGELEGCLEDLNEKHCTLMDLQQAFNARLALHVTFLLEALHEKLQVWILSLPAFDLLHSAKHQRVGSPRIALW